MALFRAGDLAGAERLLARADPRDFNAVHLRAGVKRAAGDRYGALDLFDAALKLNPNAAQAHFNRANLLAEMERFEDAITAYAAALALQPDQAEGWLNRARALAALERFEEALASIERSLQLRSHDAEALYRKGAVLALLGRHGDALAAYEQSLQLRPDAAEVESDRGVALYELGRRAEAMASFDRAIALTPNDSGLVRNRARAEYNKSAVLAEGDLAGFEFYERRRDAGLIDTRACGRGHRQWRGEDLSGVLHVWPEMGVGEEILFAGLLPIVHQRGLRIVVECDGRVAPLLRRSMPFLEAVHDAGIGAPIDDIEAQCALASLGHALGLRRGDIVSRPAFLKADADRAMALRRRYQSLVTRRRIIGLAWRSKNATLGERKSARLADWETLLRGPYLFVNLQYGDVSAEIAAAQKAFGCEIIEDEAIDQMADLDAFAAQIAALDAIVTISNTTAHMAGALGQKAYVLVPPERRLLWYWGVEGEERTIWYESLRLIGHDFATGWPGQAARAAILLEAS